MSNLLLTNADLDHVLGLFALREGGRLSIFATAAVRRSLTRSLGLDRVLQSFCGATWRAPSTKSFFSLSPSLLCRAVALPGKAPKYDKAGAGSHSVAYQFKDQRTGGLLLVAPDVAAITEELQSAMEESQVVLFDGTFWSSAELAAVKRGAPGAARMGHVTIRDSLKVLAGLAARHKVYLHINNTNPILACQSPERSAVEAAGIVVGYDGLSFDL